MSQLVALSDHVDALPNDGQSVLRNEEKRIVMMAVHALRMVSPENLEQVPATTLQQILLDVENDMSTLSQVITRKYLLHSGIPRQITSGLEMPQ